MMEKQENLNDAFISRIVKKGSQTLPNDGFEAAVMLKIQAELGHKREVRAKLQLSKRFFIWAMILAAVFSLCVLFGETLSQYGGKTIATLVLFIVSVVVILSADNYKRIINMYQV